MDGDQLINALKLLGLAAAGGTLIGLEREWSHKSAGLRTHMLVSVGAAMFALLAGSDTDRARVIQGIAAGVGFIGGGAIMKDSGKVEGITTATTIWIAAAIGACIACEKPFIGVAGSILAVSTLVALRRVERWVAKWKR